MEESSYTMIKLELSFQM